MICPDNFSRNKLSMTTVKKEDCPLCKPSGVCPILLSETEWLQVTPVWEGTMATPKQRIRMKKVLVSLTWS